MTSQSVLYTAENGVATITLNRPEVHNAFDEAMIEELAKAFEKAGADKNIRAVLLRGAGESFCAGGDLNWMKRVAAYTHDENVKDAMQLGKLLKLINELPKVTIALIHGNAFGGGVGLAACCDIAIAEEDAVFCLSEVRIGLIPSVIAPYVLAAIGERQARRLFLTAEKFDAHIAHRIGFVHKEVAKDGLDEGAERIVKALQAGAPGAQARGKKLILDIVGRPIDDAMVELTSTRIAEARASDEGKEGLAAFLNKTEPSWRKKQ